MSRPHIIAARQAAAPGAKTLARQGRKRKGGADNPSQRLCISVAVSAASLLDPQWGSLGESHELRESEDRAF